MIILEELQDNKSYHRINGVDDGGDSVRSHLDFYTRPVTARSVRRGYKGRLLTHRHLYQTVVQLEITDYKWLGTYVSRVCKESGTWIWGWCDSVPHFPRSLYKKWFQLAIMKWSKRRQSLIVRKLSNNPPPKHSTRFSCRIRRQWSACRLWTFCTRRRVEGAEWRQTEEPSKK